MDVPFRGMQRQHGLEYLAALAEPDSTGLDSQINFQAFPGADKTGDYEVWGVDGVSGAILTLSLNASKDNCSVRRKFKDRLLALGLDSINKAPVGVSRQRLSCRLAESAGSIFHEQMTAYS